MSNPRRWEVTKMMTAVIPRMQICDLVNWVRPVKSHPAPASAHPTGHCEERNVVERRGNLDQGARRFPIYFPQR